MHSLMHNLFLSLTLRGFVHTTKAKAQVLESYIPQIEGGNAKLAEMGGVRVLKLGTRRGDNAELVRVVSNNYIKNAFNAKTN